MLSTVTQSHTIKTIVFEFDRCQLMNVKVEFYGIARVRAGIALTFSAGSTLGDVLIDLANRFPRLAESCIDGQRLRPGFTANLGGNRFVSDPATALTPDEVVMLLSLDAGG